MLKIKEKVIYKAFGFKIMSDIAFPELYVIEKGLEKQDIKILNRDLSKYKSELENNPYFHKVIDNQVLFYIPDVAFFSIQGGHTITFSPLNNVDEDLLRLYLLGTCMGVVLMQRRILPLHGSAVEINGKAYAFIGDSGAGKSTLASTFMKQGFSLVSDDVIPITISNNRNIAYVTPSYPQQKLWQESLDHLGMDADNYRPIFERETKFNVPIQTNYHEEPLPLAAIFELSKGEGEEIKLLQAGKLQGLNILLSHTYRNFLIPRLGLLDWHFDISAKIIKEIDLYQLQRPNIGFTANDLVAMVLGSVKEEDHIIVKN
jgi:hypothetical protein